MFCENGFSGFRSPDFRPKFVRFRSKGSRHILVGTGCWDGVVRLPETVCLEHLVRSCIQALSAKAVSKWVLFHPDGHHTSGENRTAIACTATFDGH